MANGVISQYANPFPIKHIVIKPDMWTCTNYCLPYKIILSTNLAQNNIINKHSSTVWSSQEITSLWTNAKQYKWQVDVCFKFIYKAIMGEQNRLGDITSLLS